MNSHHLILGETTDFLTGKTIKNTHDEQYRQKLSRLLVQKLDYQKADIIPRLKVTVKADDKSATVLIDFTIRISEYFYMLIKYGPGSLVTRHRPALGLSRILSSYQIPLVVVTNGEDADILDGKTGKVISSGLHHIPSKSDLLKMVDIKALHRIPQDRLEMESRIVYAFEIDDKCPCDDTDDDMNQACRSYSDIDDGGNS